MRLRYAPKSMLQAHGIVPREKNWSPSSRYVDNEPLENPLVGPPPAPREGPSGAALAAIAALEVGAEVPNLKGTSDVHYFLSGTSARETSSRPAR